MAEDDGGIPLRQRRLLRLTAVLAIVAMAFIIVFFVAIAGRPPAAALVGLVVPVAGVAYVGRLVWTTTRSR